MRNVVPALAVLLFCAHGHAADIAPTNLDPLRHVEGNVIVSGHDPALRIEVPKGAVYVGADRWALYDIADCEVHVFVEADARKKVQRFYWIQFEGYLPARPELRHSYNDKVMDLSGVDVFVRARFGPTNDTGRAGSDLEHVMHLIAAKGYTLPPEMANVRLVRLLDPGGRKELMIIYDEDMEPTGLMSADLITNGKPNETWDAYEPMLIARATKSIVLSSLP